MAEFWPANIFYKISEFLAQGRENFVFVFDRFYRISSTSVLRYSSISQGIPSKKGINSSLVRSAPSARAIVDSR